MNDLQVYLLSECTGLQLRVCGWNPPTCLCLRGGGDVVTEQKVEKLDVGVLSIVRRGSWEMA